jgi:predicted  nucleic acid-binding Zn-ribbon protein
VKDVLSEQERMNNAMKEMQFHEESMAKKYSGLSQEITDPKLQQMLKGMEMAARNNYSTLSQKMSSLGIV